MRSALEPALAPIPIDGAGRERSSSAAFPMTADEQRIWDADAQDLSSSRVDLSSSPGIVGRPAATLAQLQGEAAALVEQVRVMSMSLSAPAGSPSASAAGSVARLGSFSGNVEESQVSSGDGYSGDTSGVLAELAEQRLAQAERARVEQLQTLQATHTAELQDLREQRTRAEARADALERQQQENGGANAQVAAEWQRRALEAEAKLAKLGNLGQWTRPIAPAHLTAARSGVLHKVLT